MIDFSVLDEFKLPELDADGYIYFLFYKNELVYIGKSQSLVSRIGAHRGNKIFDKVLYLTCPVEQLIRREKMFIQHYNPILNGEYQCAPKKPMRVIGDYLFIHEGKRCIPCRDGKIIQENRVRGVANDRGIMYIDLYDTYTLKHSTNEYSKKSVSVEDQKLIKKWNGDKYETYYDLAYNGKKKTLPAKYVFKFGKYKGKTAGDVMEINKSYVPWFMENVPQDSW